MHFANSKELLDDLTGQINSLFDEIQSTPGYERARLWTDEEMDLVFATAPPDMLAKMRRIGELLTEAKAICDFTDIVEAAHYEAN